jgi:tetratricopeptide (TPR) repeat protein
MDSLITTAARALATGDPLAALKRVALRDDPPALALRGIAMAQIGDLARASELLRAAARGFGAREPLARARCILAEAEIAFVSRDLGRAAHALDTAQKTLKICGDRANTAHAGYLEARRLLLIGRLDQAQRILGELDFEALPLSSRVGYWLVAAGIAMRRVRAEPARAALDQATQAARGAAIPSLTAEVDQAMRTYESPAARLISNDSANLLRLDEIETLLASDTLIVDACRNVLRAGSTTVSLARRPVLFALIRALAEAWPKDVAREILLDRVFRAKYIDESHRARLRVEIARLRAAIRSLAAVNATKRGFALNPRGSGTVAVLTPPVEADHADVLALLSDGEAWSSSALVLALGVSPRTVQRALTALAETGRVESFGRGRACRWLAPTVPGFPTSLLLPAPTLGS